MSEKNPPLEEGATIGDSLSAEEISELKKSPSYIGSEAWAAEQAHERSTKRDFLKSECDALLRRMTWRISRTQNFQSLTYITEDHQRLVRKYGA